MGNFSFCCALDRLYPQMCHMRDVKSMILQLTRSNYTLTRRIELKNRIFFFFYLGFWNIARRRRGFSLKFSHATMFQTSGLKLFVRNQNVLIFT